MSIASKITTCKLISQRSTSIGDMSGDSEGSEHDPIHGYWYFNVGKRSLSKRPFARDWEDNREFGFISFGHPRRYLNGSRHLLKGSHIFAYLRLAGYVGYGVLNSDLVPAKTLVLESGTKLANVALREPRVVTYDDVDDSGVEYAAQVHWIKTLPKSEAKLGVQGNSGVTGRIRDKKHLRSLLETFSLADLAGNMTGIQRNFAAEGRRKYYNHLRTERRYSNRLKILDVKGYACEACGFDFLSVYGGEIGKYAEVHHLKPLCLGPQLTPTAEDFAVLCANCHRAIHLSSRTEPMSLLRLRSVLEKR